MTTLGKFHPTTVWDLRLPGQLTPLMQYQLLLSLLCWAMFIYSQVPDYKASNSEKHQGWMTREEGKGIKKSQASNILWSMHETISHLDPMTYVHSSGTQLTACTEHQNSWKNSCPSPTARDTGLWNSLIRLPPVIKNLVKQITQNILTYWAQMLPPSRCWNNFQPATLYSPWGYQWKLSKLPFVYKFCFIITSHWEETLRQAQKGNNKKKSREFSLDKYISKVAGALGKGTLSTSSSL